MKELLSSKLGKAGVAVFLLLVVFWVVLRLTGSGDRVWPLLDPILLALILTAVLWVALELGFKAWQRRRQASFDAKLAAREGIEDRKREWAEWTAELSRQAIDRYQLPMYLLVGEPQSGKSVMLRNSDLHFPFGQSRLSGLGGTKGCDWWFTDQAVILDLAGRLFTHEGGASDEAEWQAFLELLADFRPQCPANGVILVLPCDGLAGDAEAEVSRKAAKMQNALTTLTDKLQARLPVYVVLTKADKVFGFAECVHRLDAPKRHEMFGWSRALERLEAPFDADESRRGFEGLVERARLLRSQMLATARIPEALGEIDRFYAFPEELAALWPNLALYLQRVFTESRLIDKLFFRGFYLTSGLQSGAPIAKVCSALMGSTGEADRRSLEGLFTKQRAYFIKDLVRERIFTEQGLVRPTRQRVVRARRNARLAYAVAGVVALVSFVRTAAVVAKESDPKIKDEVRETVDEILKGTEHNDLQQTFEACARLQGVVDSRLFYPYRDSTTDIRDFLEKALEVAMPALALEAARDFPRLPEPTSFSEFESRRHLAATLLAPSLANEGLQVLLAFFAETRGWNLSVSPGRTECALHLPSEEKHSVRARLEELWNGTLEAGSGWALPGALGVFLACGEERGAGPRPELPRDDESCDTIHGRANAIDLLFQSRRSLTTKEKSTFVEVESIRMELEGLEEEHSESLGPRDPWKRLEEVRAALPSGGARFEVPAQAMALLGNTELGRVCAPSFLGLDLETLTDDLAHRPPATNPEAEQTFLAKEKCTSRDYVAAYPALDGLRARLPAGEPGHVFDAELSAHLGSMLKALSGVTADADWHDHVQKLVDEYEGALLRGWSSEAPDLRTRQETELRLHLENLGSLQ